MNYIVFDTETTGTGTNDEVIQFGGLLLSEDLNIQKVFNWFCYSQVPIDPDASRVTGLTAKLVHDLSDGKYFEDFYYTSELFKMEDVVWCGYNVGFDIGKINTTLRQNGLDEYNFGTEINRLNKSEGRYYFDVMKLQSLRKGIQYSESLVKAAKSLPYSDEKLGAMYKSLLKLANSSLDSTFHNALYDAMITWLLMIANRKWCI